MARRRRESQLTLALSANVSQRHLSFIESGRAQPSRDIIVRLCDALDIPLREAAGDVRSSSWALLRELAPIANCGQAPTEDFETLAPTVPLEIFIDGSTLAIFNTITSFGTPQGLALQELRIEMAFPADSKTDWLGAGRCGGD
jgi:transcriptional regulator with XRE-family HTH domain